MKLTIEHVLGYLPYNLEFMTDKGKWVLDSLEKGGWTVEGRKAMFVDKMALQSIKPLLRPLYDLTDAEWLQVFQAGFDNSGFDHSSQFSKIVAKIDGSASVLYRGTVIRFIKSELSFHHWPIKFNQLLAFREIYKLHGDIEGLIEQGLAIKK